jgi:hypothetical protein
LWNLGHKKILMFGLLGDFCATVLLLLYMLWLHTFPQQDSVIQTDRNWVAQVCGYRNCTMSFMPWIVSRQTWSASNKKKSHSIARCHGGVCFLYHPLSCWISLTELYGMKGVLTIELPYIPYSCFCVPVNKPWLLQWYVCHVCIWGKPSLLRRCTTVVSL